MPAEDIQQQKGNFFVTKKSGGLITLEDKDKVFVKILG